MIVKRRAMKAPGKEVLENEQLLERLLALNRGGFSNNSAPGIRGN